MDQRELLLAFGFRLASNSVHTSRTLMLGDLSVLLDSVPESSDPSIYAGFILGKNVLGKRTIVTRRSTLRHLSEIYALNPAVPVFRLLRRLWSFDQPGRPVLALLCAMTRDGLLKASAEVVLARNPSAACGREEFEEFLETRFPNRFRLTTLRSTAQNLASSWTQSGHLRGKRIKHRSNPVTTPYVTAFALFLAHLTGHRGKGLLDNFWTSVLDTPRDKLVQMAAEASRFGLIDFRSSGAIVQVGFRPLLTPEELRLINDQDRAAH